MYGSQNNDSYKLFYNMSDLTTVYKLEMEPYLIAFVQGRYLEGTKPPYRLQKDCFLGEMIYQYIEKVPFGLRPDIETFSKRKAILEVEVGFLGNRSEPRKNPMYNYFLPPQKKTLIVKEIKAVFDELLYSFMDITKQYTEEEFKTLLESFCEKYTIDFAMSYETLKKKYYRARKPRVHLSPKNDTFSNQTKLDFD